MATKSFNGIITTLSMIVTFMAVAVFFRIVASYKTNI
jgi:hypothetical protein